MLREAEALMLVGEVQRGCELGERAATAVPTLPAAQLFLGKCFIRLGDSARACQHYRRYVDLAPGAPDQLFVRAILERCR
jgi:hypothetical protein